MAKKKTKAKKAEPEAVLTAAPHPMPVFPMSVAIDQAQVLLQSDGTITGDTKGFQEAARTVKGNKDHNAVLIWLILNAIRE